jgi:hypothetical protein
MEWIPFVDLPFPPNLQPPIPNSSFPKLTTKGRILHLHHLGPEEKKRGNLNRKTTTQLLLFK